MSSVIPAYTTTYAGLTVTIPSQTLADWLSYQEKDSGFSQVVVAYLRKNPERFLNLQPYKDGEMYYTARAWIMVSGFVQIMEEMKIADDTRFQVLAGFVGRIVAEEFMDFYKASK